MGTVVLWFLQPCPHEECSERDSGTRDSKRSYDNMESNIMDHVIHNFLSARGEGEWWVISYDYNITILN